MFYFTFLNSLRDYAIWLTTILTCMYVHFNVTTVNPLISIADVIY